VFAIAWLIGAALAEAAEVAVAFGGLSSFPQLLQKRTPSRFSVLQKGHSSIYLPAF
jgi:hypothetical protein